MRVSVWTFALALAPALQASAYTPESTAATDALATEALENLIASVGNGTLTRQLNSHGVSQRCEWGKAGIRREYSTLTNQEKLAYTGAVKCLMAAPSKLAPGLAPGAKSRYDDFVTVHVNQTNTIHLSGWFLSWHRYYLYSFEQALRQECGYKGYVPYWNWGKSAKDPINSPYMDGSPYSQGGNGVWKPHNCTRAPVAGSKCLTTVVEGRGGGCVETGPYVGIEANLSSVDNWFNWPNEEKGPWMGYQPRCMTRDISPELTRAQSGDEHLLDLLTNPAWDTIGPFQDRFQVDTGLHASGHFAFSGNPGGDVYTSPNDPLFWLNHGMVDRVWWIWQNLKPVERTLQIAGTRTMANTPPSANATIEDILNMGVVTPAGVPASALKHHLSTIAGPYCYIYL